jgi:cyclopropane-fatty-acyl-phospholipid synthase
MHRIDVESGITHPLQTRKNMVGRTAKNVLIGKLRTLREGQIRMIDGKEEFLLGERNPACSLRSEIVVHSPDFYRAAILGGTVGAAEGYMAGSWNCTDLTALVRILVRNRELMDGMESGWAGFAGSVYRLAHFLRRNTRKGGRKNIAAHYDLGEDFFSLFLDETMTYSCGIFEHAGSTLKEASVAKYDRICRKLALRPDDHVLEIGTGWGGFAVHAAAWYGCRVTTTTISRRQYEYAARRIREKGLTDRVELLLSDYRDLSGTFDKLVSIEMIEAVGHQYLETFFRHCSERLTTDGMMLLQAITIPDDRYDLHTRSVDFIKRYIFPGSFIPSITAMSRATASDTDLRMFHLEDITPHYTRTLREWRVRFLARRDEVRALGYPESFLRMWEYYLCYCEGSFEERYNGNVQIVFTKPRCRREPILPPLPNLVTS